MRDALTPEEELARLRCRQEIMQTAMAFGVRSAALNFVTFRAEEVFTLRDGTLVPKDGARHPSDPLRPLDIATWLTDLQRTEALLFDQASTH